MIPAKVIFRKDDVWNLILSENVSAAFSGMKGGRGQKMKGIASFDIDMTLLDHKTYEIPESAFRALEKLRERYYIVLATGRDLDSKYSSGFEEMILPDAVIHLNGTKITVGKKMIYEHCMDRELVKRLLQFAEGKEFAVGLTTGTEDYYINPQYVTVHDMIRWGESSRNFKNPWELLHDKVRTLTYIGEPPGTRLVEAAFPEVKLPLFSSRRGADIIELAASKAEGLKRLCEYFGVKMKDTVAFGDSMNDFEIVQAAGIGIAMGNAEEALKAAADYVTTAIDEDGIWNACVKLGLIDPD